MKRFHVHVSVKDLQESVRFYSKLFGAPPLVEKSDYAKWMPDDPRISFAISQRGRTPGVNHLGFQVESDEELKTLRVQVAAAGMPALDEPKKTCCYAQSDKYWVEDPQGIAWETFHTLGSVPIFEAERKRQNEGTACCTPSPERDGAESAACCDSKGKVETGAACC